MTTEQKLTIHHVTEYHYSKPVMLNPHQLFLVPSPRGYFDLLDYKIQITPTPQGSYQRINLENCPFQQIWFDQATDKLKITVDMILSTKTFNPYGFIVDRNFVKIDEKGDMDFDYPSSERFFLQPYLQNDISLELRQFAHDIKTKSSDLVTFLMGLTEEIHRQFAHIIREEPGLLTPEKTWSLRQGSCRDLAWLLIHLLRAEGIASRFVSGYAYNPELDEGHELHAWTEAYCPGAGWVGLDPNLGLLADNFYFPLTSSFRPENTLPVSGNYSGAARSEMESFVEIREEGW